MADYTHSDVERLIHENSRLKSREAKEKSQAVEYTEKAVVGIAAAATGFALGVYNAQNGATAENPVQVGGQVPADALAAGLGAIAILATPTHGPSEKLMPLALGFGGAAIGIWGQRAGFQWQQARAGATPAAGTTTAGSVGWGGHGAGHGGMMPRMAPPGGYGGYRNAYVDQYAGV
jgi:hypothetical protein